jgi:nucleoside 2-deoxyribosyltransferase
MALKVYLCGGFHTRWQDTVEDACRADGFVFINPKLNWKRDPSRTEEEAERSDKELTTSPWWPFDRLSIDKADIVFAYLEEYTSTSGRRGTGDIFELGMAFALGKIVICVNEVDHRYYRGIARLFLTFPSLNEAIMCLKSFSYLTKSL